MQAAVQIDKASVKPGNWQGNIAIGFGIGVFCGTSGDNHIHQHLAHQLSFSMQRQPVQVSSSNQLYQAQGLFIPAGTPHQLMPQHCCSIYMDSTHHLAGLLLSRLGPADSVMPLPEDLTRLIQHNFRSTATTQSALQQLMKQLDNTAMITVQPAPPSQKLPGRKTPDQQLRQIFQLLYNGALQGDIPDRRALAAQLHLSPSRFSHWFAQHTGIPLRTYRKWLRLIYSMQYLQQQALTDIAHRASFADHAHFSRTCMQMFGLQPSRLQGIRHIELMNSFLPD